MTEVIYLIQYSSNRKCLIVDGKVLHDDEKDVPDYVWMAAIRSAAPTAFIDLERVNHGQFEYVRNGHLRPKK